MMKRINHLLMAGTFIAACTSCSKEVEATYQVIPLPQEVSLTQEDPFRLNQSTIIAYPEGNTLLQRNAEFLAEYLQQSLGFAPQTQSFANGQEPEKGCIRLDIDDDIESAEGYTLKVDADGVEIEGQTPNGVFYGIQTLRKSIPAGEGATDVLLPAGEVKDAPRFGYRGFMLDCSRHFFPVEFVKKFIDILALHNINTFHWHITDDQGWRIEIKKYPRLTEIGSTRNRTVIGRNTPEYDNTPYGGFYTQEEAREIVRYAQERYITVIPEVDLPGHMLAALAAYPELGCTGGPYEVCPNWGVFEDVLCIGNEKTFEFLEGVLDEIIDIFPARYIHIGGDEVPRTRWEKCPKCQARIRQLGLRDDKDHTAEDRLQSYCMARIEKYLNGKGRQIIGWDEILEGEVAPNATVMSWRGLEGGIEAAQLGHDVVMVPTSYAYLDYYQTDNRDGEPLAIGGYVPIEKVYSLEPVPDVLTDEQKKHIIGAQANLWTEYILNGAHVEYMALPRMAALSEVQWTLPEKKNYDDFRTRLMPLLNIYKVDSINYSKAMFDIKATYTAQTAESGEPGQGHVVVEMSTIDNAPIYYTLDGTDPTTASTAYTAPVNIDQTAEFRAVAIRPDGQSKVVKKQFNFNKATLRPIEFVGEGPSSRFTYKGAVTLVDGISGPDTYSGGPWIGFYKGDAEVVIDLGEGGQSIHRVGTHANIDMGSWIMGATGMEVLVSDDKKEFRSVAAIECPEQTDVNKKTIENYEVSFDPVTARYLKVIVKRAKALPKGHPGEGKAPYLFIDEIEVD